MKERCERGLCGGEGGPVVRSNARGPFQRTAAAGSFGLDFTRVPTHANSAGKLGAPQEEDASPISIAGNGNSGTKPAPKPALPGVKTTKAASPKLSRATVSGPKADDCGGFKWVVQWKLDKKTTKGGWVVQNVTYPHNIKTCDDKKFASGTGGTFDPAWVPFWEAWEIHKDQDVTTYAETGDLEDDTFGSCEIPDTKGDQTIKGKAEFYEGLSLPADFKATGKAPSFILPATKTAPTLSGGTGSIDHTLKATWNCCKGSKSQKSVLA